MVANKEKNFISAVVYVHNNEDKIEYFLEKLDYILNENFEKYEIICVNDASTDKSIEYIKKVTSKMSNTMMSIINMSYYQGIELSMNAGIDLAIGDFVYEFDNIFIDYDLKVIMDVYRKSLKGYDIVSAKSNGKRHISSKLFYSLFNKSSNFEYNIDTETFRIVSRRAINRVNSMNKTIPYRKAIYANCGLKTNTITYNSIKNNKDKITKENSAIRKDLAIDSIVLFTNVAYKFAITMLFVMMLSIILIGIYTIAMFLYSKPIEGWTTTMLLLSFGFFGIFLVLLIVIKYLSILVDLIFKKQEYIIESIEKITK